MENVKVKQILKEASTSLDQVKVALFDASRECVKTEAGNEWDVAKTLFSLAENADSLNRQIKSLVNGSETKAVVTEVEPRINAAQFREEASERVPRKRKEDYPKYEVRGDRLVKIGLGRDKRTEYEHEIAKGEFDKILARLTSIAASQKQFTVDQVQEGLDCPVYQTYALIAVLAKMGLLTNPRRGTYRFTTPGTFSSAASTVWERLQSK
jgi:hypothetical protein